MSTKHIDSQIFQRKMTKCQIAINLFIIPINTFAYFKYADVAEYGHTLNPALLIFFAILACTIVFSALGSSYYACYIPIAFFKAVRDTGLPPSRIITIWILYYSLLSWPFWLFLYLIFILWSTFMP